MTRYDNLRLQGGNHAPRTQFTEFGMAHALADLAEQDSLGFQARVTVLDHLSEAELSEREVCLGLIN